jgi:hypothetical protein
VADPGLQNADEAAQLARLVKSGAVPPEHMNDALSALRAFDAKGAPTPPPAASPRPSADIAPFPPKPGEGDIVAAGKQIAGVGENVLSGITGGAGSLADALTGSDPGTHDWAYRPRTEGGQALQQAAGRGVAAVGHGIEDKLNLSDAARQTLN